jgi:hypothetical protein
VEVGLVTSLRAAHCAAHVFDGEGYADGAAVAGPAVDGPAVDGPAGAGVILEIPLRAAHSAADSCNGGGFAFDGPAPDGPAAGESPALSKAAADRYLPAAPALSTPAI